MVRSDCTAKDAIKMLLKDENNTYSKMSMAEFISAITVEGEAEYDTALSEAANSLVPEMEYSLPMLPYRW